MKSSSRDFVVGLCAIIALAGFAFMLLLFGELTWLFQKTYPIQVHANTAAGLREGSQVMLEGVVVGKVSLISIEAQEQNPVRMTLAIYENAKLPAGVVPKISAGLISGGSKIDLKIPATYVKSDGVIDPASRVVLVARFTTITDRLDDIGSGVERVVAGAQAWLGDEQMRADFKSAVWKANELITQATATADGITKLSAQLQSDSHELLKQVAPAFAGLTAALDEIRALAKKATNGDGTVGRLMNDPELFENLSDASRRLEMTMRDLQLLIRKIKEEGLGVSF
ncbi:MAG: MCE family protein [Planctomycetota bacterium]|nr:MAG: MCE family protein [Planctomycetota bacterium]